MVTPSQIVSDPITSLVLATLQQKFLLHLTNFGETVGLDGNTIDRWRRYHLENRGKPQIFKSTKKKVTTHTYAYNFEDFLIAWRMSLIKDKTISLDNRFNQANLWLASRRFDIEHPQKIVLAEKDIFEIMQHLARNMQLFAGEMKEITDISPNKLHNWQEQGWLFNQEHTKDNSSRMIYTFGDLVVVLLVTQRTVRKANASMVETVRNEVERYLRNLLAAKPEQLGTVEETSAGALTAEIERVKQLLTRKGTNHTRTTLARRHIQSTVTDRAISHLCVSGEINIDERGIIRTR
jgi:DNA-binding transcriptional MerR regulator